MKILIAADVLNIHYQAQFNPYINALSQSGFRTSEVMRGAYPAASRFAGGN